MPLTLNQKLRRFPPVACRLLARRRCRTGGFVPLTDAEIVSASHLRMADVKALSWETDWDNIPVGRMIAFMKGCGIDLENRRTLWNHWRYLKNSSFGYLQSSPDFESFYIPLAEEYMRTKQ